MEEAISIGDRVKVHLDAKSEDWFEGTVVRIDPYSEHRSFYWVELDVAAQYAQGGKMGLISVFNPRNIQKV